MIIECTTKKLNIDGKLVNQLGNYLYKHLDGAYKFEKEPNMFTVYCTVLYTVPTDIQNRYKIRDDIHEMDFTINLTTYSNKIRMNIIEISPDERTLGFDTLSEKELIDMPTAYSNIRKKFYKRIYKTFSDYEFII